MFKSIKAPTLPQAPVRSPTPSRYSIKQNVICKINNCPSQSSSTKLENPVSTAALNCDRRTALMSAATAIFTLADVQASLAVESNPAVTAGLNKYIKKKKLDSIDTYVPQLLEARNQLVRTERVMIQDPASARSLLRTGVFKGIRANVRAVGEYVADRKSPEEGSKIVTGFFSSLEKLDAELFTATRTEKPDLEGAKQRYTETLAAFNAVIDALPEDAVQNSERFLKSLEDRSVDGESSSSPEELEKLKALL